ncbi:MAG TPA: hypothetical protein VG253_06960 [Streptosporangiaceae bacterium]|jgi:uncharacterized protein YciI|nr:hypothetical protein [Streptosporangiaceae bacterium]
MSVDPDAIKLDTFQLVLLRHTKQGRAFDEKTAERIFREHFKHVTHLVATGQQLAAGPVRDSPAEDEDICGLGLFHQGSLEAVRALMDSDPGVRLGLYCYDVMTWLTPQGGVAFPGSIG